MKATRLHTGLRARFSKVTRGLPTFLCTSSLQDSPSRYWTDSDSISTGLQAGDSRVDRCQPFQRLMHEVCAAELVQIRKPLKRLLPWTPVATGLKPGVNETCCWTGYAVAPNADGVRGRFTRTALNQWSLPASMACTTAFSALASVFRARATLRAN